MTTTKIAASRANMVYECRWTDKSIAIDGNVNKTAWKNAACLDKFLVAGKRKPATFGTEARLLWSDTHLYFAAEMDDADIFAQHNGHDSEFGNDDVIELFIKPSRKEPFYWELHVLPTGGTRDYFYARRGAGSEDRWKSYDTGMKAAVTLDGTLNHWEDRDKGWTAEMSVPWEAFAKSGGRPKPGDVWTFLVSRYDYSVYQKKGLELSASCYLPKVNYHLYEAYADLVFTR